MKALLAIVLLLFSVFGAYSQSKEQIKKPHPKITYKHAKSRHKQLKAEVLNKIINPVLCESVIPVSDITVDFCPEILGPEEERGCKNEANGELTISITINWEDGSSGVRWIEINKEETFDKDVYLGFLRGMPRRMCAGRGEN